MRRCSAAGGREPLAKPLGWLGEATLGFFQPCLFWWRQRQLGDWEDQPAAGGKAGNGVGAGTREVGRRLVADDLGGPLWIGRRPEAFKDFYSGLHHEA